jgi:hypothetical protein
VTGWGRTEQGDEDRVREWMSRGRKDSWEGEQCIVTRKGGKVKGISIRIRN